MVVSQTDLESIQAGVERRLAVVESLIPPRPMWRAAGDRDLRPAPVQVVAGPALREAPLGSRRLGLLFAVGAIIVLMLAYGLAGGGGQPSPLPSEPLPTPSATVSAEPSIVPGALRPVIEPRLTIPVRPKTAWTVVEDGVSYLDLAYFLDELGTAGYNVGLAVLEPHGVYDPVVEAKLLPLPADLIAWIRNHPDLESNEPVELTVAGMPARAIDVTVTYQPDGPKGQTAQFIYDGVGSWNLELNSKKRIVLVELPDRPLLIVFGSRPEFWDAGIEQFEDELRSIQFEERGPSP
jgi:hypothetical protein